MKWYKNPAYITMEALLLIMVGLIISMILDSRNRTRITRFDSWGCVERQEWIPNGGER